MVSNVEPGKLNSITGRTLLVGMVRKQSMEENDMNVFESLYINY